MDFELTAILAIKDLFPEVKIVGCYFHYSRSLWRKAKQLGITKSKMGVIHVNLCTQLSYLPPNFLDEGSKVQTILKLLSSMIILLKHGLSMIYSQRHGIHSIKLTELIIWWSHGMEK